MIENIIFKKLTTRNPSGVHKDKSNSKSHGSTDINECFGDLYYYVPVLDRSRVNEAHRYIYSCRKGIGKAIVFGKRVVRKLLKWYINPITEQQTVFNNAATACFGRLTEITKELFQQYEKNAAYQKQADSNSQMINSQIEEMRNEIVELTKQNENYEAQMKEQVALFEQTIEELRAEMKKLRSQNEKM